MRKAKSHPMFLSMGYEYFSWCQSVLCLCQATGKCWCQPRSSHHWEVQAKPVLRLILIKFFCFKSSLSDNLAKCCQDQTELSSKVLLFPFSKAEQQMQIMKEQKKLKQFIGWELMAKFARVTQDTVRWLVRQMLHCSNLCYHWFKFLQRLSNKSHGQS